MSSIIRKASSQCRSVLRALQRPLLVALGLTCVGLALLGVALPGLPTTIFLILASFCFTRSSPALEARLLRSRVFRPYLHYVHGDAPIPPRARVSALVLMWMAVSISLAVLARRELLAWWLAALVVAAACAGTLMILSWRRSTP